jgi:hypothetical protein
MIPTEHRKLRQLAIDHRHRYYGKYRGIVSQVLDGDDLGKLVVKVPEVYDGQDSPVAWPCVPFAGDGHGFVSLPEVNDGVWIEFEAGDPSRPIWTGSWWGANEIPDPAATNVKTWVSSGGLKITLDDANNELRLEHSSGASIKLAPDGLTLAFNATTMTLDDTGITLNDAVTVTKG